MMLTLKPGQTLRNGSYRIDKVLGQGGFGITYLATNLFLNRKVAIKEFFPKSFCGRDSSTSRVASATDTHKELVEKLKAKFLKEAINIAKLDHPGIIKIHDAFEENDTAYYVMDYIEGKSLSDIVKSNGPLPENLAKECILKIGKALEYVHSQKINHLDVKPANIMVKDSSGEPVLIDFGLSKQYDSDGNQTSTTPTGISHGFAPMEQYIDGGVTEFSPQTDLYSLAATLYFVLTAKVPPHAPKLVEDGLQFPPSVSSALKACISKAMSPVRKNRYSDIASFLESMSANDSDSEDTFIPSHPSPPSPPSPPTDVEEDLEPKKRNLLKWIIIGISVLAVAAVAIWFATSGSGTNGSSTADPGMMATDSVYEVEKVQAVKELTEDTSPYEYLTVDESDIVKEVPASAEKALESDNPKEFFKGCVGKFSRDNILTLKGAFTDGKRDYPIEIKFRLDGNDNISSCTYYNTPYNTKLSMDVRFSKGNMTLRSKDGSLVIILSPIYDGAWAGSAQSGNMRLEANVKSEY